MRRRRAVVAGACAAVVAAGAAVLLAAPAGLAPGASLEDVTRANNRGVALMEQFRHAQAMPEFAKVTAAAPRWAPGFVNYGLAALYAREIGRAADAFREAIRLAPDDPHGHYGLATLLKSEGKSAEALAAFETALALDPEDADILYNVGVVRVRQRQFDAALPALRRARQIDPNNASIRYQLARALLQSGKRDEGEKEMAAYQKLSADPKFAVPTGAQYGEAGRYALVIADYRPLGGPGAPVKPNPVRFSDATASSGIAFVHGGPGGEAGAAAGGAAGGAAAAAARYGSGVAIGDFDGDGRPDLVLVDASARRAARPALYRNRGDWTFEDVAARSGVTFEGTGMAAVLGDYDNDKDADLYLTHKEGGRLYRNDGKGTFEDVTAAAKAGIGGFALGASWVDLDHDGDLDLFVSRIPAPGTKGGVRPVVLINRLESGFADGGAAFKIDASAAGTVGAVFADLDADRDIDAVLSAPGAPDRVLDNRRDAGFQPRGPEAGLAARGAGRGVAAGDVNGDGFADLVFASGPEGAPRLHLNDGRGAFRGAPLPAPSRLSSYGAALFDADNDADLDLFLTGSAHVLLLNDGAGRFTDATRDAGLHEARVRDGRAAAPADLDGDGDLDLVVTTNGGPPVLLRNEGGSRNRWLAVRPRGLGSNQDGIGAKIDAQSGALWQRREVQAGSGWMSQGPPEIHFGLRERGVADFVRILWPGGVLQAEIDVVAGERLDATELDRKGSSCPSLFAWNGGKYGFVNDFLGTGGIGMWLAPGVYGRPDPDEYVKIEPHQLAPRDGAYYLQVMENLEEVTYLDEARLYTLDHPRDLEVHPHEHFGAAKPPDHRLFAVPKEARIFPSRARDHRDRDVTEAVTRIDRVYPDGFRRLRLAGYAEEHHVTLEFPDAATRLKSPVLFLYGWVDFEYASTNFAAHQAGIPLTVPVLEMENDDGLFAPVIAPLGFPAGMPRMMTVDLAALAPLRTPRFRLRTNMRVFWDQIYIAQPLDAEALAGQVKVNSIPIGGAHLHRRGFPRVHSPDGREPKIYDYGIIDSNQPFKAMSGEYTRFGRVTELLQRTDDRFVIFGKGEEVTLEFPVKGLPATPKNWTRSFMLYASGYCKDMDPHTAHPDSVEPLPFAAMSGYPYRDDEAYPDTPEHREYRRTYNTRRIDNR